MGLGHIQKSRSKYGPRRQSHETRAESLAARSGVIWSVASTAPLSLSPSFIVETLVLQLGHIVQVCSLSSLLSRTECLWAANQALCLLSGIFWWILLRLCSNGSEAKTGKVDSGTLSGSEPWAWTAGMPLSNCEWSLGKVAVASWNRLPRAGCELRPSSPACFSSPESPASSKSVVPRWSTTRSRIYNFSHCTPNPLLLFKHEEAAAVIYTSEKFAWLKMVPL